MKLRSCIKEAVIKAKGGDAHRHIEKYIIPFLKKKNTHTIARNIGDVKKGSKVSVMKHQIKDGKHHVVISHSKLNKNISIPVSYLNKPEVDDNKGVVFERNLIKKLKKHGLMKKNAAAGGNTAGNDFHLIDNRNKKHKGREAVEEHTGETKENMKAAFGQITIHYSKNKGWYVPEESASKRPLFASALEKATVTNSNGKTMAFLKYLDKYVGAPSEDNISQNIYSDYVDLQPMHNYLHDHGVGILHIGSHGTYRAGRYQKKDETGVNFPEAEGRGRFRARFRKNRPGMFVEFKPYEMVKSHLDLMNDSHIAHIRKKLGHK